MKFSKPLKVANLSQNATKIVRFLKNVQSSIFLKNILVSRKKILNFFKIAKGSKFAVKCDWNSKISQNVQNMGFFKEVDGFFEKKNCVFRRRKILVNVKCD